MRNSSAESGRSWRNLVKLPAFLAVNLVVLLLVGMSTVRETYRGWTVENEVRALEAQAVQLEGRKLKLAEVMDTLSSPEHVDFEARARLGWKKEGERVYVIPGFKSATSAVDMRSSVPSDMPVEPVIGNPRRWLGHFLRNGRQAVTVPSI